MGDHSLFGSGHVAACEKLNKIAMFGQGLAHRLGIQRILDLDDPRLLLQDRVQINQPWTSATGHKQSMKLIIVLAIERHVIPANGALA